MKVVKEALIMLLVFIVLLCILTTIVTMLAFFLFVSFDIQILFGMFRLGVVLGIVVWVGYMLDPKGFQEDVYK